MYSSHAGHVTRGPSCLTSSRGEVWREEKKRPNQKDTDR